MVQQLVHTHASVMCLHFVYCICNMKNMPYVQDDFHGFENSGRGPLCHDTIAFHRLPVLQREEPAASIFMVGMKMEVAGSYKLLVTPCETVHGIKA